MYLLKKRLFSIFQERWVKSLFLLSRTILGVSRYYKSSLKRRRLAVVDGKKEDSN